MPSLMEPYSVCPRCRGKGKHVNPAVDGDGLTSEDLDELGPEFIEDYLGGLYDVSCERCGGNRVIRRCQYIYQQEPARAVQCDQPAEPRFEGCCYDYCYNHLSAQEQAEVRELNDMLAMELAERRAGA